MFEVGHTDRALEFFMVKRDLNKIIAEHYADQDLKSMSCEMIAMDLKRKLEEGMGYKEVLSIAVFEDGENGARVEWDLK